MPETAIDRLFLDYSARKLEELTARIETCLASLTDEQIWLRQKDNENAVANLVLHLCGNVRQWIISNIGGQPDDRVRAAEFAARIGPSNLELQTRLRFTVDEALHIIRGLTSAQLSGRYTIQGYDVSVLEAIYHVVEHFSMHAGQIIFITKMLTEGDLGFYKHLESAAPHSQWTP